MNQFFKTSIDTTLLINTTALLLAAAKLNQSITLNHADRTALVKTLSEIADNLRATRMLIRNT